jgi:hypothetical protein
LNVDTIVIDEIRNGHKTTRDVSSYFHDKITINFHCNVSRCFNHKETMGAGAKKDKTINTCTPWDVSGLVN